MQRRIQEKCQAYKMKFSHNSTGDLIPSPDFCNRPIQVIRESNLLDYNDDSETGEVYQILSCGHSRIVDKAKLIEHSQRNLLFDRLLPFQKEFVEFAEQANLRCLCTDRMGLGKTVESLSVLRENAAEFTDNFTKYCLIVTPVGGIYQWKEECDDWLTLDSITDLRQLYLTPQVVVTSKQHLTPLAKIVICPWSKLGDKFIKSQLLDQGIASLIVDEAHFYKDPKSQRTKHLLDYVKAAGTKAPLLFLTGTPVENRVMELKVALNCIDPNYFYSWEVLDRMCIHTYEGKALGIHPRWRDHFFSKVSKYWIGRTKEEVKIPLPELRIQTETVDPYAYKVNEEIVSAYNTTLDELENLVNGYQPNAVSVIGLMQQLRHLTGRMKIMAAAVWIDSWMTMNPGEKLAVGIHHIFIREALAKLLQHRNPLQMSDENPKEKDEIECKFRNGYSNLLICSIISAGVGRNFQFCKNALVLERQWNKSKENQFIERFHRIIKDEDGRVKTHFTEADTVNITIMNCQNSFDEFFDEMIHLKEIIVDSTDDAVDTEELPDVNFTLELAQKVIQRRMKWVGV